MSQAESALARFKIPSIEEEIQRLQRKCKESSARSPLEVNSSIAAQVKCRRGKEGVKEITDGQGWSPRQIRGK